MVQCEEMMRKGPWTEQEDVQLVFYVNLFGDRRWDFIAKVSGLKRTGKSCRLRWVNYLHPGLKRGKMTPHEERLVLELHSKWGNRWSRIARKLPGRTDNEIKNYWRTHMRKKAQERKKAMYKSSASSSSSSLSSSSSDSSSSSSSGTGSTSPTVGSVITTENKDRSFYDTGGFESDAAAAAAAGGKKNNNTSAAAEDQDQDHHHHHEEGDTKESGVKVYSQDEIWNDIELSSEDDAIKPLQLYDGGGNSDYYSCHQTLGTVSSSPVWDYSPVSLWMTGDEDINYNSFYNNQDMMSFNDDSAGRVQVLI